MPLRSLLVLLALALSACSGEDPPPSPEPARFSADVRSNFLTSCVDNAAAEAGADADPARLRTTCECILQKVEQEYDEASFAAFEQRLMDGSATEQESTQLEQWSTTCAEENAG